MEFLPRAYAETEVEDIIADVRRGLWRPPAAAPVVVEVEEEPTFHVYASEWVERRRHEVEARTVEHWEWALSGHLLAFFRDYRPSQINGRLIDQYKAAKLREREEIEESQARKQRLEERGIGGSDFSGTATSCSCDIVLRMRFIPAVVALRLGGPVPD